MVSVTPRDNSEMQSVSAPVQYDRLLTPRDDTSCRRNGKVNRSPDTRENGNEDEDSSEAVTEHMVHFRTGRCLDDARSPLGSFMTVCFYTFHASDMIIYDSLRDKV
jgi:hypothetical protein